MPKFPRFSATPSTEPGRRRRLLRKSGAASAVCAALVAATLSTAVPSQAATAPALAQHPSVALGVLSILNQERAAYHLPALSMNAELVSSAYHHNATMAAQNVMSHQCKGEASLGARIDAVHYDWSTAGENVGWNSAMTADGAHALEIQMYNEKAPNDGHRLIILSRAYHDVGISVVTDTKNHKLWLTEDFGHLM